MGRVAGQRDRQEPVLELDRDLHHVGRLRRLVRSRPAGVVDYDGLGIRVPLLVISPYAKQGYVSHVQYEYGSILKFVEDRFGLPRLAASDTRANSPARTASTSRSRRELSFRSAAPSTKPISKRNRSIGAHQTRNNVHRERFSSNGQRVRLVRAVMHVS